MVQLIIILLLTFSGRFSGTTWVCRYLNVHQPRSPLHPIHRILSSQTNFSHIPLYNLLPSLLWSPASYLPSYLQLRTFLDPLPFMSLNMTDPPQHVHACIIVYTTVISAVNKFERVDPNQCNFGCWAIFQDL